MSARPRPVTATFKPKPLEAGVRPRAYSLSSGGSTESLVSVLDHDSCDGDLRLTDSEDEREQEERKKQEEKEQRNNQEKVRVKRHRPKRPHQMGSVNEINNKTFTRLQTDEDTEGETGKEGGADNEAPRLSCWEVWLLAKAKEERQRIKREKRLKRRDKEEERKKKQEAEEKKQKGEKKYEEWLEKMTAQARRRSRQECKEEKVKKELKEAEKQEIERKSKEKFEKWLTEKNEKEKENRRKDKERKQQEKAQEEEQKEKSEEAYRNWLEKARVRPRSAHHSFGYASGKLTGYYDNSAVPVPTFYNPIPWQPVEIPQKKTTKKGRPKSAYRWNPNKYL